jgi:hypothetical protein
MPCQQHQPRRASEHDSGGAAKAGGGISIAKACLRSGVGHCLSSLGAPGWGQDAGAYMEAVAAAGQGLQIFQLYVRGDWDFICANAERAIANGCVPHCTRL